MAGRSGRRAATPPPSSSWCCATRTACTRSRCASRCSEADARDCVQEGLISAWRAIDRFRGDARFSTWIYRIVLRKAYDVIERRKRTAPSRSRRSPAASRRSTRRRPARPDGRAGRARARLPRRSRRLRHHRHVDGGGGRGARRARRAPSSRACTAPAAGWPRPSDPPNAMSDEPDPTTTSSRRPPRASEGPAAAPPDLADEVMRQVRAEPRRGSVRRGFAPCWRLAGSGGAGRRRAGRDLADRLGQLEQQRFGGRQGVSRPRPAATAPGACRARHRMATRAGQRRAGRAASQQLFG